MTLDEYQEQTGHTAFYPDTGKNLTYPLIGLAGEVGELCNKWKKLLRQRKEPDAEDKLVLADELGDCLWYVAAVAKELGYSLSTVANINLTKLAARRAARQVRAETRVEAA